MIASELLAAIRQQFDPGEWFLAAEAVLRCGVWNAAAAGDLVAAGHLLRRAVPRHDPRLRNGRTNEYALPLDSSASGGDHSSARVGG